MDHYVASSPLDCDPNLPLQRATAMFACFCGKREVEGARIKSLTSTVFVYRDMEDGTDRVRCLLAAEH